MTSNKQLNVLIVGYGLAGSTFHAPLIKATTGMNVGGIIARSPVKQEQARKDFPQAKIFTSLEELENEQFDLAVIATPNKEHAPQAIHCLTAGLAVVIDKPMALSLAEGKQLLETSKKCGQLLSVFQNRRWDNDFLTLKELIENNAIGKVLRLESRFERYRRQPRAGSWRESSSSEAGGGLLFDLGSHLIDQACFLFGKPETVYAEIDTRRDGVEADDDCFVSLQFKGDVRAHLWMSAIAAKLGPRFRLLGLDGAYEKYGLDPQEDCLRNGGTPLDAQWGEEEEKHWGTLVQNQNGTVTEKIWPTKAGAYENFYAQMREAILGKAELPVNAADALNTLSIIETARKSAQIKEPVSLSHC